MRRRALIMDAVVLYRKSDITSNIYISKTASLAEENCVAVITRLTKCPEST